MLVRLQAKTKTCRVHGHALARRVLSLEWLKDLTTLQDDAFRGLDIAKKIVDPKRAWNVKFGSSQTLEYNTSAGNVGPCKRQCLRQMDLRQQTKMPSHGFKSLGMLQNRN